MRAVGVVAGRLGEGRPSWLAPLALAEHLARPLPLGLIDDLLRGLAG